jgi:D-xylose transport system substrate-binding protein
MRLAASVTAVTAVAAALLLAGCASGDAGSKDAGRKTAPPGDSSAVVLAGATRPIPAGTGPVKISVSDFNSTFSAMKKLKPVTKAGRGLVGVLLPDTAGSDRYTRFDGPYLKRAFSTAGLPGSLLIVQNALGSDATQLSEAQAEIVRGARVLILDPLDSGVGQAIESYAKRHGVSVIDYDWLTLGGSRGYYVSFDNVAVGKAMGLGLASCVSAWHVKRPKVIVMKGDPTDPHAALLAQGYDGVLAPYFKSGRWTDASNPAGTWTPAVALSEFIQQYKAHPGINAALTPDDVISGPIISYLKGKKIKAKAFPVTGQQATLPGLRNALAGYQCGTAYEPDYLEAQGAAAVALFLRASLKPPASLLNGHFKDPQSNASVPSVLFKPVWVTTKNMKSTVIADKYVTVAQLCAAPDAAACKAAGIT